MVLNPLILFTTLLALAAKAMAVPPLALPGCREKCGNLTIPYPFGVKEGCYKDPGYLITCKRQDGSTLKAYRGHGTREVVEISLSEAYLKVKGKNYPFECFNARGKETGERAYGYDLSQTPYTFSTTRNKFIAIGCDTVAYITEAEDRNFTSGCVSLCRSVDSVKNGSCSGIGCCQTSIPLGLKSLTLRLGSFENHTTTWKFNPCSFAFLADQSSFTFDLSYLSFNLSFLSAHRFDRSKLPVVFDWAIGNQTCEEALHDTKSYACGPKSYCSNSTNGPGYRCYCEDGFEGNPYLLQVGCQDIDECEMGRNNSCDKSAFCTNTQGSYSCSCPQGYYGDGLVNGTRCTKSLKGGPQIKIVAGIGVGCLILPAFTWFLYWTIKKRRLIKLKEKFFQQNGGILLRQQIDSYKGVVEDIAKIFTIEDIKKATNNFHEDRILGQGGFGTVFKGFLSSGKIIAIKRSKMMDKSQIIQFINEVDILSRINHRHVVKLLGCCLETAVPLLVYEFVSNGTLYQHIHSKIQAASLSWENRLRIAAEAADALAYLHSSHSVPIFHRDVKSSNILLDDKYKAKVADFGASRLVPLDQTQKSTVIQGTYGYLDPECFPTGQLTDKSDVYSFGVVLVELLTGKMPILSEGYEEPTSLAKYFVSSMKEGNLLCILDDRIVTDGNSEQLLVVAELARNCLKDKRKDRLTMKEVAKELDSLKILQEQSSLPHNQEETEICLGGPSTSSTDATLEIEFGYSLTDDDLCKNDKVRGKRC